MLLKYNLLRLKIEIAIPQTSKQLIYLAKRTFAYRQIQIQHKNKTGKTNTNVSKP